MAPIHAGIHQGAPVFSSSLIDPNTGVATGSANMGIDGGGTVAFVDPESGVSFTSSGGPNHGLQHRLIPGLASTQLLWERTLHH
jgi:hypothetical protein